MTNQQLLQAVYARLGGKPDSAPEPLILAKTQEAIKSVVKELVYGGHPLAVEFVKSFQNITLDSSKRDFSNKFFVLDISGADYPIIKTSPKLLSANRKIAAAGGAPAELDKIEATNSWDALESLPALHNQPYYKWSNNKLYFRVPETTSVLPASIVVEFEHYAYPTLAEFPYELVDVLLAALIPMLMPQAPQPEPKNEGKKKQ